MEGVSHVILDCCIEACSPHCTCDLRSKKYKKKPTLKVWNSGLFHCSVTPKKSHIFSSRSLSRASHRPISSLSASAAHHILFA